MLRLLFNGDNVVILIKLDYSESLRITDSISRNQSASSELSRIEVLSHTEADRKKDVISKDQAD